MLEPLAVVRRRDLRVEDEEVPGEAAAGTERPVGALEDAAAVGPGGKVAQRAERERRSAPRAPPAPGRACRRRGARDRRPPRQRARAPARASPATSRSRAPSGRSRERPGSRRVRSRRRARPAGRPSPGRARRRTRRPRSCAPTSRRRSARRGRRRSCRAIVSTWPRTRSSCLRCPGSPGRRACSRTSGFESGRLVPCTRDTTRRRTWTTGEVVSPPWTRKR